MVSQQWTCAAELPRLRLPLLFIFVFCCTSLFAFTIGDASYIADAPSSGSFPIAANGHASPIYVDANDDAGVVRAAHDLQSDIHRITAETPNITHGAPLPANVILIGTIGSSTIIDQLIRDKKIDVGAIRGKWESNLIQVVSHPSPGVESALVIAGSDKRGTIFGIYDVSEQIGVSPWYWWADVPVPHRDALYVKSGRYVEGEPAVKYRGIFLNDEAPSLTNWVNEKYGGFNHFFYERLFELLLRLKANYLWPAMWNSAFYEDDPLNGKLANEYGIVMGTSHHEPMMRAFQEWQRHDTAPWDYATNAAIWMLSGNTASSAAETGKVPSPSACAAMVTSRCRRQITLRCWKKSSPRNEASLRKTRPLRSPPIRRSGPSIRRCSSYYEKGMRVPDDVTLLWSDDNWGNICRLPTPAERKRSGGAGIYYHFDYVGDPRSYKWLNTYPITKIWEQMDLAHAYGANRIWVVNVGDLKPMEFPIEFFLDYAREPNRWNQDSLSTYTKLWSARHFGPEHAAGLRTSSRNTPSTTGAGSRSNWTVLQPDSFRSGARGIQVGKPSRHKPKRIQQELPPAYRDAFFELVLYPVKASAIVNELYITAGENRLFATQGRVGATDLATRARTLFADDVALSSEYNHQLAHGKWDHMMDQTHIGYTYWNQPPLNAMPAVSEVQPASGAKMGIAVEGTCNCFRLGAWICWRRFVTTGLRRL